MNLKNRAIAVLGLGYVGLPLAVEFGKKRPVIGFDIKADRISGLQAGHDCTLEVSEDELRKAKYLTFTSDSSSLRSSPSSRGLERHNPSLQSSEGGAVVNPDGLSPRAVGALRDDEPMIFIITVPTPVDKANRPDLAPLIKASETVGRLLKAGDVVIYESTVFPGATEEVCVPILERESGLRYLTVDSHGPSAHGMTGNEAIPTSSSSSATLSASHVTQSAGSAREATLTPGQEGDSVGFYCAYSPERINPGDKTHRLPDIKKITSGSTPEIAEAVNDLYREIITAGTHKASSIKVAEAAKVIENAQRDLNIAFVNELSVIFNRMGIDTSEVLAAASTKWNFLSFKPGLVGGHCIGVDPYYLTHKAQELGYRPQVILSGRAINDNMGRYAARNVIRLMLRNGINVANASVGVMGITFKENCPDVRNSKVIDIIQELQHWGLKVKVMDPWASEEEVREEYGLRLIKITPQSPVDSLIIAVAHSQFAQLTPREIRAMCTTHSKPVIADLKALHSRTELESQGFSVFRF